MEIILIILLFGIIIYNLIVNLTNITIIVKYCIGTNTLGEYWTLYFKNCFSLRAIYSSIFGLILAILLFFILIPIILVRKVIYKGKIQEFVSDGLIFQYNDVELNSDATFFSNCNDYGFAINRLVATGKIAEDVETILHSLIEYSKNNSIEIKYEIMKEMYVFSKDKTAVAPLMIRKDDQNFPVYILYDDNQINQYKNVKELLQETRFKDCIYFSVKNF